MPKSHKITKKPIPKKSRKKKNWKGKNLKTNCKKWYENRTDTTSSTKNPATGVEIEPPEEIYQNIEKICSETVRKRNPEIFKYVAPTQKLYLGGMRKLRKDLKLASESYSMGNGKMCSFTEKKKVNRNEFGSKDLFVKNDKSILCLNDPIDTEYDRIDKLADDPILDIKKKLQGSATDFTTSRMFTNSINRLRMIALAIKTINIFLKYLKKIHPHLKDVLIIFKGGTSLRMLLRENLRNLSPEIEDYISARIRKETKISDFDFEIISPPNLLKPDDYVRLNMACYIATLAMRNHLIRNKKLFFPFLSLSKSEQRKQIKKFIPYAQNELGEGNSYTIDGIEVDGSIIWRKGTDKDASSYKQFVGKSKLRSDFARVHNFGGKLSADEKTTKACFVSSRKLLAKYQMPDEIIDMTLKSKEKGDRLYATHNPFVYIPNDKKKPANFALNRIKYSYSMYISGPKGKMILSVPGEVFDMSHAFEMDRKKDKYLGDIKHNPLFESHKIYAYDLKLLGYSALGFYKDTSKIIFYDVDHKPWVDVKYKKRIIRVVSIVVLSLFGNDQENSNIPYLQKLRYLGDVINSVENDFKKWSKLPFNELGCFQIELYNTYIKNGKDPKYKEFKATVLEILNEFGR